MKKCFTLLLAFLLSMTGIAGIAESDFSSYTEAELRDLRMQINSAIAAHSYDEGKGAAVCDAFIQYMEELGHSLELTSEADGEFFFLLDPELNPGEFTLLVNSGYNILPAENFPASNEDYIRDCMVALAMAVARVEGVEIFSNEVGTATRDCMWYLPEGFFSDNINISWENKYGYRWLLTNKNGATVLTVR